MEVSEQQRRKSDVRDAGEKERRVALHVAMQIRNGGVHDRQDSAGPEEAADTEPQRGAEESEDEQRGEGADGRLRVAEDRAVGRDDHVRCDASPLRLLRDTPDDEDHHGAVDRVDRAEYEKRPRPAFGHRRIDGKDDERQKREGGAHERDETFRSLVLDVDRLHAVKDRRIHLSV